MITYYEVRLNEVFFFMNETAILFKIGLKNLEEEKRNYIFNDFSYGSSIFQFNFKDKYIIFSCLFCYLFRFYFFVSY